MLPRAIEWLAGSGRPEIAVFGAILIGALLAVESGLHETYLETLLSAIIATALYWLAHAYTALLAGRLRAEERLTATAIVRGLRDESALARGAAIPQLVIVIGWVAGATRQDAITAAVWSVVASIIAFELVAARISHASRMEGALDVLVGAMLGVGVLMLKVFFA